MRYIKELSQEERQQLGEGFRTGTTHRYRMRCQSILLSSQGYRIGQLASMFEVDRDTVSRWFNDWEAGGMSSLADKPRSGRPAKLRIENEQHVQEVKKQLAVECQNLDKVRVELADSLRVEVSKKTLNRFLKSLAIDGSAFAYRSNPDKTQ